jgi:hypothetical protein
MPSAFGDDEKLAFADLEGSRRAVVLEHLERNSTVGDVPGTYRPIPRVLEP